MNEHVMVDGIPKLTDISADVRNALDELVTRGYVLETVSKTGIPASLVGYRYFVTVVEFLLTEKIEGNKQLLDRVAAVFHVTPYIVKRGMELACPLCRYENFKNYIFDFCDRERITAKMFAKFNVISFLTVLTSHCVDAAYKSLFAQNKISEREMPKYKVYL